VTFLSVVVPVYNEGDRIGATIRTISEYLASEFPDHEIVAVDDGSADGSAGRLERLAASFPRLRVVQYTPNQGKGVAVRRGLEAATGQWILIVDADLELPIELLRGFFRVQAETGAQVVIGSKRHVDSVVEYPKVRARLSRAYGRAIRVLFRLPVTDTQVGFKLIARQAAEMVLPRLFAKRFAFDVELLVLLNRCGAQIAEAPIELHFSREEGGRIRFNAIVNMARETGGIFYRLYVTGFYSRAVAGSILPAPPTWVPSSNDPPGWAGKRLAAPVSLEAEGSGGLQRTGDLPSPLGRGASQPVEVGLALGLEREADGGLGVRFPDQTVSEVTEDEEAVDRPRTTLGNGLPEEVIGPAGPLEVCEGERTRRANDRTDLAAQPLDRPGVGIQHAGELDRDTNPVGTLVLSSEVNVRGGFHADLGLLAPHRLDHEAGAHARAADPSELVESSRRIDARDQDPIGTQSPSVKEQGDQLRLDVLPRSVDEQHPVPVPVERRTQQGVMSPDRSTERREIPRLRLWRTTEEIGRERRVDGNDARSHAQEGPNGQARGRSPSGVQDYRPMDSGSFSDPP
jgi:glycosyltransferase involved in cell wall biosynthesis